MLLSWAIVAAALSADLRATAAQPLSFVLSGNPVDGDRGPDPGCTYTADPPYTNHTDPGGRKLLNGERDTAGIDAPRQDVTFDLTADCRIDGVELDFTSERMQDMPASVEVLLADQADGPWLPVGKLVKEEQTGNAWSLPMRDVHGRFVRLVHRRDAGRWFLSEVRIHGNIASRRVAALKRIDDRLVLVEDGVAHATIVEADDPAASVRGASLALQGTIREMTGVWLPVERASAFDGESAAVLVGASDRARARGVRVRQDFRDGDHYVIRVGADHVALVGNDADHLRGSAYAVYDLLGRLGCGWYGPDALWRIVPRTSTLAVRASDVDADERPAFAMRCIWMVSRTGQALVDAWRLGARWVPDSHAMKGLVPRDRYGMDHPEWFSTMSAGKWQPCLTHPEVVGMVAAAQRSRLDARGGALTGLSISPNDNIAFCACARCRATGNAGARMVRFANALARSLRRTHAGRFVLSFVAYWATHAGPDPAVRAAPEVCAMFVNEGNHVQPWSAPEPAHLAARGRSNTRELRDFAAWRRSVTRLGIREWWIPGCKDAAWRSVPWYSGRTAIDNLRYWHGQGVRYVHYETGYEHDDPLPLRWPLYHVAARAMWDPDVDSDDVMREACARLYGRAAGHMIGFYGVLERAVSRQRFYGGKNWHLPPVHCLYDPSVVEQADRHLEAAAAAAADAEALARVRQQQAMWSNASAVIAAERRSNRGRSSFDVVVDGRTVTCYRGDGLTPAMIRLLHQLPDGVPIHVVAGDSRRLVGEDDTVDLNEHVTFSTGD